MAKDVEEGDNIVPIVKKREGKRVEEYRGVTLWHPCTRYMCQLKKKD